MTWVHGIRDEGVMAFTEFGIESLVELIKCIETIQTSSAAATTKNRCPAA